MLKNLRNNVDFYLRNKFRWGRAINPRKDLSLKTTLYQKELRDFLTLFSWGEKLLQKNEFRIADVGTRTFSSAPVLHELFSSYCGDIEIHGYELDAYRRFTNLKTRADYGKYFAKSIPKGFFHPTDFNRVDEPFDLIIMLNPFVTREPLLAWGLPLSAFRPNDLFSKSHKLTRERGGFFLTSSPNEDELKISHQLAKSVGFKLVEEKIWNPESHSLQKQPRLGSLWLA